MDVARCRALAVRDHYGLRTPPTDDELAGVCVAEGLTLVEDCPELVGRVREVLIGDCLCLACDLEHRERRWLVAHGLGHWLLHEPGLYFFRQDRRTGRGQQERQADEFAGWLLCSDEGTLPPPEVLAGGIESVCAWATVPYLSVERWLRSVLAPGRRPRAAT